MPKNWGGENSKSAQAKARKDAVRREETERKQKAAEDKLWEDNDKHVLRKQQRKEDTEKKHLEKLQKKEESKKLLDEEMKQLKSAKPERHESAAGATTKVTKYEIDKIKEAQEEQAALERAKVEMERKNITEQEPELIQNVNRIQIDGDVARNVDEAISILTGATGEVDQHPEKRMRAAYAEFEEENLERLKKENPNMRLSQIRQMLKKEWQKSPKNPMNKIFIS